jgi:fumarate hydratase subunit alpha
LGENDLDIEKMIQGIRQATVKAGSTFRPDQIKAYEDAISREDNSHARWVLERILENALLAERKGTVLCDDSGVPHIYVEIGDEISVDGRFFQAIIEGVQLGLRDMPGRSMAVKGEPLTRLAQTEGLYEDPGMLVPGPMIVDKIKGETISITILLQGGGPELRGRTGIIHQKRSAETYLNTVIKWGQEEIKKLGCTPCAAAIGIGRSHTEAGMNMIKAMAYGDFGRLDSWERRITDSLNRTETGPLGLGGKTTALGTFLKIGNLRASGFRSVNLRLGCCFEPRRGRLKIFGNGDMLIE